MLKKKFLQSMSYLWLGWMLEMLIVILNQECIQKKDLRNF